MAYYPQIIFIASILFFFFKRLEQYLRFLQQEEYSSERFLRWIKEKSFFDTKATSLLAVLFVISLVFSSLHYQIVISLIALIGLVYITQIEPNPRKEGKIKLNLTKRAKRIFNTSFFLVICAYFLLFLVCSFCLSTKIFFSIVLSLIHI